MKQNFIINALVACGLLLLLGVTALFFAVTTTGNKPALALDAADGLNPAIEARTVEVRTTQYVDRPVITVERETKFVATPVALRNYENLEELTHWLANFANNTNAIYLEQPGQPVDCDDFALTLQQKAMTDGYLLNVQIMTAADYNKLFAEQIPAGTLHALNLAITGGEAYYIEPQTGEIAFAAHLD